MSTPAQTPPPPAASLDCRAGSFLSLLGPFALCPSTPDTSAVYVRPWLVCEALAKEALSRLGSLFILRGPQGLPT